MMANRNYSLDYIRVVAILMIVICHYCLFSNLNSGVGRFLAGVGNMVFFMLSALLYGNKHISDTRPENWGGQIFNYLLFAYKRIIRLGSSVWPFLFVLTLLYLLFGIKFSWVDLGLNFALLGYLGKLPGNGHLWFLTVIIGCYAEYMLLDWLRIRAKWLPWALLIGGIIVMVMLESIGIAGNAFAIIGFFGFLIMTQDKFMRTSKGMSAWAIFAIVVINAVLLWLDINGLFEKSRIFHYLLCDICGFLLLTLFVKVMPDKDNKAIMFISGISFEIYIVHHTICAGPFVRISQITDIHIVNFSVLILAAIVLALMLHWVAGGMNKILLKKVKF